MYLKIEFISNVTDDTIMPIRSNEDLKIVSISDKVRLLHKLPGCWKDSKYPFV
jgi:hypothetical protein